MDLQPQEAPSQTRPGPQKIRRRPMLSCDECRRRKIKCVKAPAPQRYGSCRNCARTAKSCVFSPPSKPRLDGAGATVRRHARRNVEKRGVGECKIDVARRTGESLGFDAVAPLPRTPSPYHSDASSPTMPEELKLKRGRGVDDELEGEQASDVECVVQRRSLSGGTSPPRHQPVAAPLVSISSSLLPGSSSTREPPNRPHTTALGKPRHTRNEPRRRETTPPRPLQDLRSYAEFVRHEADRIEASASVSASASFGNGSSTVHSNDHADTSRGHSLFFNRTCSHNAQALLRVIESQYRRAVGHNPAPEPLAEEAFAKIDLVVQCAEEMVQCCSSCLAGPEALSSLVLVVYRVSEWYQLAAGSIGPATSNSTSHLTRTAAVSTAAEEGRCDARGPPPPVSSAPSDSAEQDPRTCAGQVALSASPSGGEFRPDRDLMARWLLPRVTRIRRLAQILQGSGMG